MNTELLAPDPHEVLVSQLEKRERVERLKQALKSMSSRERDVLLRAHLGQPVGTIARRLHISVKDAEDALKSARRKAGVAGH